MAAFIQIEKYWLLVTYLILYQLSDSFILFGLGSDQVPLL